MCQVGHRCESWSVWRHRCQLGHRCETWAVAWGVSVPGQGCETHHLGNSSLRHPFQCVCTHIGMFFLRKYGIAKTCFYGKSVNLRNSCTHGLFKCKSITPLLNWFSTISTYAAQLFFLLIFFLAKIGAKIFFSQKRWPPP